MQSIRHDWTLEELALIHDQPIFELMHQAATIHATHHSFRELQVCSLISIKTGGCPEDCKYCPQSSRYQTNIKAEPLMQLNEVLALAKEAMSLRATRICLGAAWREVRDNQQFEEILKIVKAITEMGVEVCCTLGMLKEHHAARLKEAGLYAYSHNLDSSERFYKTIITTRTYQDRLKTLETVEKAGISVCCGGILGMGETTEDRLQLLLNLCNRASHPESVPLNRLIPISGTPLEKRPSLSIWEFVRVIATARIVLPKTMLRLSAGRSQLSHEQQALCFLAGANSIHAGEKLLTQPNSSWDEDEQMMRLFGFNKRPPFQKERTI